jgi:phage shock protein A
MMMDDIAQQLIATMQKQIALFEKANAEGRETIERITAAIAQREEEIADLRKRIEELKAQ